MAHASGQAVFESNEVKLDWRTQETFRLLKNSPGTIYQECSETEQHIYRDWVRSLLRNGEIKVTFTKSDGTLREMRCTLNSDMIPVNNHVKERAEPKFTKKPPPVNTQTVFDLDKNEWRSFNYDRIKKITSELILG